MLRALPRRPSVHRGLKIRGNLDLIVLSMPGRAADEEVRTRAMLTAIRNFFDRHIAGRPDEPEATAEKRAHVAAAALLVEVVRSDERFSEAERQAVLESVQRKFGLSPEEAQQLLVLAESEGRAAHDLYQFTSKINASFPAERKARLIEELWRVAYADAVLHKYEEHLIRRVADLLHVPHSTFIAAKLRVLGALERGE